MAVDLDAAVWLARACLPGMLEKGWGRIVNFTGMNAIHGYAGRAPVSVAKHGVWGLTKALAKEVASRNVSVNALALGLVATDMSQALNEEYQQKLREQIPMGRYAEPEEIARIACFLLSDDARYITGQVIQADGGLAM
jgi:3-oxoacyl-[acyl-carrier protein] reductase